MEKMIKMGKIKSGKSEEKLAQNEQKLERIVGSFGDKLSFGNT